MSRRCQSPEERAPCGTFGLTPVLLNYRAHTGFSPDVLADCLAVRPKPWLLTIWEPLHTKAPCPAIAQPWCCYIKTVVFYVKPYVVRPWRRLYWAGGRLTSCSAGFEEWDKTETRLSWDDVVSFEGDQFQIGGGSVIWARSPGIPARWWMRRSARRVHA